MKLIPNEKLYTSRPNPKWFGNESNPTINNPNPTWTKDNWLESKFHFNFAEYTNPKNKPYGKVLHVLNDDIVQPNRGFGSHSHMNMEIVTYVVNGQLTHVDNIGTKETLSRGSIQFMTAGTGIVHSEHNLSIDQPLRFIQTWIQPNTHNLQPNYGSYSPTISSSLSNTIFEKNKLIHLVSNVQSTSNSETTSASASASTPVPAPVQSNQDVDGYVSMIEDNQCITFTLPKSRQAYLVCLEGSIEINDQLIVNKHDACEIHGIFISNTSTSTNDDDTIMKIKAVETENTINGDIAHFIMYTMPAIPDSGRTDF